MNAIPSPVAIRDWIRRAILTTPLAEIESELAKVTATCDSIGAADPCSSILVTTQLAEISGIKPPRSWAKEHHAMFFRMPLKIQRYVLKRENDRDRALNRLQCADAAVKRELERQRLKKEKEAASAA